MSKIIKLTIKTKSPTAISTGASSGLIDSEVLLDDYGIPFINGKRIRGLFKEYCLEALEIVGNTNKEKVISDLFGKKGGNYGEEGLLKFDSAYPKDYNKKKNSSSATIKHRITQYFSEIIDQTAINPSTQTAEEHSLRKIRAIKKDTIFEMTIDCINDEIYRLIMLATKQFKFIGSNRNRGLGWIEISEENGFDLVDQEMIDTVRSLKINNTFEKQKVENSGFSLPSSSIRLSIELITPLLLSMIKGSQNVVSSQDYIDGRKLWGVFADFYIKAYGLDEEFKLIFRDGRVNFNNAYLKGYIPIPSIYQKEKIEPDNKLINVLEKEGIAKKINGYWKKEGAEYIIAVPKKRTTFHMSRGGERTSGTSKGGEIFYYEALDKEQEFESILHGDINLILKLVLAVFGDQKETITRIGKSKGSEYGKIKMKYEELKNEDIDASKQLKEELINDFMFYFTSKCIVLNQYLYPLPTIATLKENLGNLGIDIKEIRAVAHHFTEQHYSGVWKSKTDMEAGFEKGSSFDIRLKTPIIKNVLVKLLEKGIGEYLHQGYGKARLIEAEKEIIYKEFLKQNTYDGARDSKLDDWIQYEEKKTKVKTLAIKFPSNMTNNHQLGRLISLFKDAKNQEEIKKYLNDNKDKKIEDYLDHILNWEYVIEHELKEYKEDFELIKLFFTTYFQKLKKENQYKYHE